MQLGNPMNPLLSIVIPVFNESQCLKKNIKAVLQYFDEKKIRYELVLVNDGSTDSTIEICRFYAIQDDNIVILDYSINRGKGYAVKKGMLKASGDYIIFMDADLAVPVKYIGTLISELMNGNKIVIASRHLQNSSIKIRQNTIRQFLGSVFRMMMRLVLNRVSDITCGLKGFDKDAATDIFERSRIERWGYDAEIIFIATKLGYRINEIPVEWYNNKNSKVKLHIDPFRTILDMVNIFFYYIIGRYRIDKHKIKQ